ncbi:hypothetical protein JD77_02189 [Micromonospora olivasterospora]|uniref:Uncharacterized protein n=1 Tax=Micromonospora olivasterospora TaxID=1880 RepID=A0A562I868_MICOL|nr:hypothetical protein JD77_02189 [Micromonospora olivasterospora]
MLASKADHTAAWSQLMVIILTPRPGRLANYVRQRAVKPLEVV